MRGSLIVIVTVSAIYLIASLGMGLWISALFKSQFLASQVVLIASFLPTVMMSGFIFDLKSAPQIAQLIAAIFPATWYVELMQTLFLAGNISEIVFRDTACLIGFAILLLTLAGKTMRKSLE